MTHSWIIGVSLAAVASLSGNLGLNLQKLAHIRIQKQHVEAMAMKHTWNNASDTTSGDKKDQDGDDASKENPSSSDTSKEPAKPAYTKNKIWMIGMFLVIAGSFCDFAALGFGNQSLIAPLGSLSLVANVFFAPMLLGEKVQKRDITATLVIVAGATMAVFFASHNDDLYDLPTLFSFYLKGRFFIYVAATAFTLCCMRGLVHYVETSVLARHSLDSAVYREKWLSKHRFCYAASSGIMGAQNVLFAKCVSELVINSFRASGSILFVHWQSYLILLGLGCSIFMQIKWLNAALQRFEALYVVPIFQCFWIVVSVVSGLIFFAEYNEMASPGGFAAGVLMCCFGVYALSKRSVQHTSDDHKDHLHWQDGDEPTAVPLLGADEEDPDYLVPMQPTSMSIHSESSSTTSASLGPSPHSFDAIESDSSSKSIGRQRRSGSSGGRARSSSTLSKFGPVGNALQVTVNKMTELARDWAPLEWQPTTNTNPSSHHRNLQNQSQFRGASPASIERRKSTGGVTYADMSVGFGGQGPPVVCGMSDIGRLTTSLSRRNTRWNKPRPTSDDLSMRRSYGSHDSSPPSSSPPKHYLPPDPTTTSTQDKPVPSQSHPSPSNQQTSKSAPVSPNQPVVSLHSARKFRLSTIDDTISADQEDSLMSGPTQDSDQEQEASRRSDDDGHLSLKLEV